MLSLTEASSGIVASGLACGADCDCDSDDESTEPGRDVGDSIIGVSQ